MGEQRESPGAGETKKIQGVLSKLRFFAPGCDRLSKRCAPARDRAAITLERFGASAGILSRGTSPAVLPAKAKLGNGRVYLSAGSGRL